MTDTFHLIGGDVSTSPSPAIMNAAFRALDINAKYSAVSIPSEALAVTLDRFKTDGVRGANVTIPLKSAVIPLLASCDEVSTRIGAVNTLVLTRTAYVGFNTDVAGITEPLRARGAGHFGSAVLLGAGGAARAFCEVANAFGCTRMTVAVRDTERAMRFEEEMSVAFPRIEFGLVKLDELNASDAEVLFNATPAGTAGRQLPANVTQALRRDMVVFDAVYRPAETELLSAASALGCRTIGGREMLLIQAAAAFEKWTGRRAPMEAMQGAFPIELGVKQR
jgi:shikimate dehydrogenase